MTGSLIGVSLPTFLIGILLIYFFAVTMNWLPAFGRGKTISLGWWTTGFLTGSGLRALILPTITLTLWQLALIIRLVRSEMLEVLRTDFIKFARARGLSNRAVHFHHALRNTLIPVITITGVQLGSLIAFAIITETVFQWPGMGLKCQAPWIRHPVAPFTRAVPTPIIGAGKPGRSRWYLPKERSPAMRWRKVGSETRSPFPVPRAAGEVLLRLRPTRRNLHGRDERAAQDRGAGGGRLLPGGTAQLQRAGVHRRVHSRRRLHGELPDARIHPGRHRQSHRENP